MKALLAERKLEPDARPEGNSSCDYVSAGDAPVFLSIGGKDKPFRVAQM